MSKEEQQMEYSAVYGLTKHRAAWLSSDSMKRVAVCTRMSDFVRLLEENFIDPALNNGVWLQIVKKENLDPIPVLFATTSN